MKQNLYRTQRYLELRIERIKASKITERNKQLIFEFYRYLVLNGLKALTIFKYMIKLPEIALILDKDFEKANKASKRATIVLYNPETDSSLHKKDIPSVIIMQFNLRKGKLHATTQV